VLVMRSKALKDSSRGFQMSSEIFDFATSDQTHDETSKFF